MCAEQWSAQRLAAALTRAVQTLQQRGFDSGPSEAQQASIERDLSERAFEKEAEDPSETEQNNTPECNICLEPMHLGDHVVWMPRCPHLLHVACMLQAIRHSRLCPACRADICPTSDLPEAAPREPGENGGAVLDSNADDENASSGAGLTDDEAAHIVQQLPVGALRALASVEGRVDIIAHLFAHGLLQAAHQERLMQPSTQATLTIDVQDYTLSLDATISDREAFDVPFPSADRRRPATAAREQRNCTSRNEQSIARAPVAPHYIPAVAASSRSQRHNAQRSHRHSEEQQHEERNAEHSERPRGWRWLHFFSLCPFRRSRE